MAVAAERRCRVSRRMTRPLRKRPAGLTFHARQQPFHELPGAPAWLGPHEPARDTRHRLVQDDRHSAGSTLWHAATARSSVVLTNHR